MFIFLLTLFTFPFPVPENGYQFNEGKEATVIHFKNYHNLIIIPARLNDSVTLKLILDTGTTSLILFGPKAAALTNFSRNRKIHINGRGYRKPKEADFSFPNKLTIGDIVGNGIGAAVLRDNELASAVPGIDGIIGYELFSRFCIQIDYPKRTITFYDEVPINLSKNFRSVDLSVTNQRPEIISRIRVSRKKVIELRTLIDTGSSLGLVVFTSQVNQFDRWGEEIKIGTGLAGSVIGSYLDIHAYEMGDLTLFPENSKLVSVEMTEDNKHCTTSSLGGDFLRNFVVMFHYPTSKFFIKL